MKAVVTKIPAAETFVDLLNAIAKETGESIDAKIVFQSSGLYLVEKGMADIAVPCIETENTEKKKDLLYDYSSVTIFKLAYVLYTKKGKDINVEELKSGNPKNYKITTITNQTDYFKFQTLGATDHELSFRRIELGNADGHITAQTTGDIMLKKLGLKDISRQFYGLFNSKFALQKGKAGSNIDKILTDGIEKLKANGMYDKILGDVIKAGGTYNDWQP